MKNIRRSMFRLPPTWGISRGRRKRSKKASAPIVPLVRRLRAGIMGRLTWGSGGSSLAARFRLDHLGAPELQPSFDGTKMDVESFGSVRSGPLIATHSVLRLFGEGLLPAIGGSFGEHGKFLCGARLDVVTVRRREH
jgi:hypothetical protein